MDGGAAEGDAVEAPSLVRFDGVVVVGVDMVFFFFFSVESALRALTPFRPKVFRNSNLKKERKKERRPMSDATGAAPAGAVEEAAPAEAVPAIENNVSEEERAATGAREAVADAAPPLAAPTDAVVVAKEPTPTPPAPPPPPAAPPAAQPSAGGVYGRSLTEKEQLLIAQRVREQQAAFRAWEEREAKRKVRMHRHANSRFPPLPPPPSLCFFLRPRPPLFLTLSLETDETPKI